LPALTESLMVKTAALVMIPLAAEVPALPAGLFEQVEILDFDGFVERFEHVVNRERGHRGGRERFHFHAGLPGGGGVAMMRTPFFSTAASTSAWVSISGMAQRNQLGTRLAAAMPAMRAISSGLPLGLRGSLRAGRRDAHEGVGARVTAR
jgi:hypothetical protein